MRVTRLVLICIILRCSLCFAATDLHKNIDEEDTDDGVPVGVELDTDGDTGSVQTMNIDEFETLEMEIEEELEARSKKQCPRPADDPFAGTQQVCVHLLSYITHDTRS